MPNRRMLARLAGDEFAVVLTDVPDRDAAHQVAQDLQCALDSGMVILGRQLGAASALTKRGLIH